MQTNPFLVPCPSDSRPAPKAVTWASEHHGKSGEPWTGKWIWKQLCVAPKAASAPTPVSTSLSAAQIYQKSPLTSISKISAIFCLHFVLPVFIFKLSGSHNDKGCHFGCHACFLLVPQLKSCCRHCLVHGFVIFLASYSPHCKVYPCTFQTTESKEHLVTTFPVSSNYHCSCREINISQASSSPSQLQKEMFFKVQSTEQDTTPGGVIFVLLTFLSHQRWNKKKFDAQALARSHSFVLLPFLH